MSASIAHLQRLFSDEHITNAITSSYTYEIALSKLGLSLDYYQAIIKFAKLHDIKTNPEETP